MKNEGSGIRDQGSGPTPTRIEDLLRQGFPPIGDTDLPQRDLWPAMRQRLRQERTERADLLRAVPWFDWALAAGILVLLALSPDLIPVLLYHL